MAVNEDRQTDQGLTITTDHSRQQWRFALNGIVDRFTVEQVRTAILPQLESDSTHLPLVLDLRAVDFLDSAGLALLLAILRHQKRVSSPSTLLVSPGSQPQVVLALMRFDDFCSILGLTVLPDAAPWCRRSSCATVTSRDQA